MLSKVIARNGLFIVILLLYSGASTWMIFEVPGLVMPNEGMHYDYVTTMRLTGALPAAATLQGPDAQLQPPVYYTVAALLSLPFNSLPALGDFPLNPFYNATHRGNLNSRLDINVETTTALFAMRFASLLFGIMGVLAVYIFARMTLPPNGALLVVALTAFHPMYLYLSAGANNDLAVTAVAACVLLYSTFLIVRPQTSTRFIVWGLLTSLAVLTKGNAILLVMVLPICCIADWQRTRKIGRTLLDGALGLLGLIPLCGAWLIYSSSHGQDLYSLVRSIPLARLMTISFTDIVGFIPNLERIWRSFWMDWSPGEFGYAPAWVYIMSGTVLVLLASGWLFTFRRKQPHPLLLWMHLIWVAATIAAFLAFKIVMAKDQGNFAPEGRWLLLITPSLAWLVGAGWSQWEQRLPFSFRAIPAAGIAIAGIALTLRYVPVLFPHTLAMAALPEGVTVTNITYSDKLELLGISAGPMTEQRPSNVHLYWRAPEKLTRDYTISAQLLIPDTAMWDKLDAQNSYPGNGLNPTQNWTPGTIYGDQAVFQPQGVLNGPTRAVIAIYVLDEHLATLAMTHNGAPLQMPIAEEVTVRPLNIPIADKNDALIAPVRFGGLMELNGLKITSDVTTTRITLWWKAVADIDKDYTVFVHVLDASGKIIAQNDGHPDSGRSPTRLWRMGDGIHDVHEFSGEIPSGGAIEIGVNDSKTGQRLATLQDGKSLADNIFRIKSAAFIKRLTP